jgi:hypothetical protein
MIGRQFLEERKLNTIAANLFDSAQPDVFAIAQLIELTGLGAQHAAEVMRRVAFYEGTIARKLFDEKSPAHAPILAYLEL